MSIGGKNETKANAMKRHANEKWRSSDTASKYVTVLLSRCSLGVSPMKKTGLAPIDKWRGSS